MITRHKFNTYTTLCYQCVVSESSNSKQTMHVSVCTCSCFQGLFCSWPDPHAETELTASAPKYVPLQNPHLDTERCAEAPAQIPFPHLYPHSEVSFKADYLTVYRNQTAGREWHSECVEKADPIFTELLSTETVKYFLFFYTQLRV